MGINRRKSKRKGLMGCLLLMTLHLFTAPPIMAGEDTVLVVYSGGKVFAETIKGLRSELIEDFTIRMVIVKRSTSVQEIKMIVNQAEPKVIVLLDNRAIGLYQQYQNSLPSDAFMIPTVSLMAVNIRKAIAHLHNAVGIAYEIPLVTSLVNFRTLVKEPVKRVGIIHRHLFTDLIKQNEEFCHREGFEIVTSVLPNNSVNFKELVIEALHELLNRVDIMWIPNDNVLLSSDLLINAWLPEIQKHRIPLIVGLEVLVQPSLNFGTFAVLPDHRSLGQQAAELIYELRDNHWRYTGRRTLPPLSIVKILNLKHSRKRITIEDEDLFRIDKVLK